jgi:cation diffusion facilitator family transporter
MPLPPPDTRTPALAREALATRSPAVRRTLYLILWINLVAVVIKIYVGVRTGSLSVLGAALDSVLDTLNNLIGMALVAVAARAPDEDHPYGHDKFETLGALAIVGFLSISCFELLREGIERLLQGAVTAPPEKLEMALTLVTVALNVLVVLYERRRARELNSVFLLADSRHTASDVMVTLLALIGLLLARFGLGALDPAVGILVALIIAWNGYQILRETIPVLVDTRGVDAAHIRDALAGIPAIQEIRTIRSRSTTSGVIFAEITLGVQGGMSVDDAHTIADRVEQRIAERLGAAEVIVHMEPSGS